MDVDWVCIIACVNSSLIIEMIWLNHHILLFESISYPFRFLIGTLALKLAERENSLSHKSVVIAIVYFSILWTCRPLQSIVDAYCLGRKIG